MADQKPAFSFSTLHTGTPITIDGKPYQIRHPDSLSLGTLKRLELLAPRVGLLLQRDDLTPSDEQELSELLSTLCALMLDAPAEVEARLSDTQRVAILEAFTQLRSLALATGGAMRPARTVRGGKRSSRGSSGSTAARRMSGTGALRSGSSGHAPR